MGDQPHGAGGPHPASTNGQGVPGGSGVAPESAGRPLLGPGDLEAWPPTVRAFSPGVPLAESTRLVDDPLSAAELAASDLEDWGISVWHEIPDPEVIPLYLTADEVLAFEVPQTSTLPVLGREGLIMEGAANLLYSFPKTGKTELLTALVRDWLEDGRRVLYLTEEPYPNWKQRLGMHGLHGDTLLLSYVWGGNLDQAVKVIKAAEFDILVVDTLRNTVGYLEGKGDEDVARIIHPLLTAATGKTSICAYHARKMPGEGGRDISGHHSLYGAFDRALQLTPVNAEDDSDTRRKIIVSGRCMYEGDKTLFYRMTTPGVFEVLDGQSVVKKERPKKLLVCRECGDEFESARWDAKYCDNTCQKRARRRLKAVAEIDPKDVRDVSDTLGSADIADRLGLDDV